jgi:RNA polymerase sigma-70 factor (TIGR02960 family)
MDTGEVRNRSPGTDRSGAAPVSVQLESGGDMDQQELLRRATSGDRRAFEELTEPYRVELQVHCYRMLGSFQDAEDALQDSLLAAWLALPGFEQRSSLRTWLYRISTNRCLNRIRSAKRAESPPVADVPPTRLGEVPWLQPFPDDLLDRVPDDVPGPEARVLSREAISLAFVTASQLLPPLQRAVLLLRDVLGYRARETADLLETTEEAVTSALARARTRLRAQLPDRPARPLDADALRLLERFVDAFVTDDVEALIALLADDVRVRMPPLPFEYEGRDAARAFFEAIGGHRRSIIRMVPIAANRQAGWGEYVRDPASGEDRLVGVLIAEVDSGRIRELTHFETTVGPSLGLPRSLGAG